MNRQNTNCSLNCSKREKRKNHRKIAKKSSNLIKKHQNGLKNAINRLKQISEILVFNHAKQRIKDPATINIA